VTVLGNLNIGVCSSARRNPVHGNDHFPGCIFRSYVYPEPFRENIQEKLIVFFACIGTLLAVYFPMENYENFLYMIGSLFAPTFSVIIADYFIYRQNRSDHLFNLPGVLAIAAGIVTYYIVIGMDLIVGSTIPSMLVTVAVYMIIRLLYDSARRLNLPGENTKPYRIKNVDLR